eukprot:4474472-Amphidinium_carterae.2
MEAKCTSPLGTTWALLLGGRYNLTGSPALLPACGLETATEKKPHHTAVVLPFQHDFVSQGNLGQRSMERAWSTAGLCACSGSSHVGDCRLSTYMELSA